MSLRPLRKVILKGGLFGHESSAVWESRDGLWVFWKQRGTWALRPSWAGEFDGPWQMSFTHHLKRVGFDSLAEAVLCAEALQTLPEYQGIAKPVLVEEEWSHRW